MPPVPPARSPVPETPRLLFRIARVEERLRPQLLTALLGVGALACLVLTPPFQTPDAGSHFLRAWQLARASGALPYLAQIYDMLDQFVASLSLLYVAALVGLARHARASLLAARIIGLIAACGRLALTNYLTQSLMMVLLLSSLGFGLASQAPFTRLALWGVVIVIGEAAASALYLRFFSTGPVEWLWRRLTYGRVG